jgi:hypothetical protein
MEVVVTPYAQKKLDGLVQRTLNDAGLTQPPVCLSDLMEFLDLSQEFYNLSDPGFLDKAKHKIRVGGHRLSKIIKKIKLQAVLFFDEKRVVIDSSLPSLKQVWPGFHEAGHRICPGHQDIFAFGDTASTLAPEYQEMLEAEANYAGSGLMFCGQHFTNTALDTKPCMQIVKTLKKDYGHSLTTTLRRYVQHGPELPMALTISTPPWDSNSEHPAGKCRHYVKSTFFDKLFGHIEQSELIALMHRNCVHRRGGPVAEFSFDIPDANSINHEFYAESFFNQHDLLTLYYWHKKLNTRGSVYVPQPISFKSFQ